MQGPTPPVVKNIEETLDRHRARLEASLEKLQKPLRQWQTYAAEYEGFKEELQELPANASREQMIEAGYSLGGTVVDSAEILSFLGDKEGVERTRDQVINAINHRITYVTENIKKVEAQIEKGQEKLASLRVVQDPEVLTEEGDPVVEIREELDENGDIISSSTHPHGQGTANSLNLDDLRQFQKYLEKAAEEAKSLESTRERLASIERSTESATHSEHTDVPPSVPQTRNRVDSSPKPQGTNLESFPSGTPPARDERPSVPIDGSEDTEKIIQSSSDNVSKDMVKVEVPLQNGQNRDRSLAEEDFVLSVDEPPDAADFRRQMIDYNLHDIGAVVAELEIEEDVYDDDDDYEDEDDGDEEEDQYGRTTRRVITADIEREMQALRARIRARQEAEKAQGQPQPKIEIPNAAKVTITKEAEPKTKKKGVTFADKVDVKTILSSPPTVPERVIPPPLAPDPDDAVPFLVDLLARQQLEEDFKKAGLDGDKSVDGAIVQSDGWAVKMKSETEKKTKSSLFKVSRAGAASSNEVQASSFSPAQAIKPTIIERTPGTLTKSVEDTAEKPKKISRFKASKSLDAAASINVLTEPSIGIYENTFAGKLRQDIEGDDTEDANKPPRPLVLKKIIEKPPTAIASSEPSSLPSAPNELDPALHRQEVSMEYFKTRNRLIQKEGGFLPREEEEIYVPLDSDKKGNVSRFKAAKLGMGKT